MTLHSQGFLMEGKSHFITRLVWRLMRKELSIPTCSIICFSKSITLANLKIIHSCAHTKPSLATSNSKKSLVHKGMEARFEQLKLFKSKSIARTD